MDLKKVGATFGRTHRSKFYCWWRHE